MRYCGGKGHYTDGIIQTIRSLIPTGGVYWEPFVGSAKIIARVRHCHRYGSDIDPHIIRLLIAIQKGWKPPNRVTEDVYHIWKERKDWDHPMVAFVGYGCSFGGKFFGGYIRKGHGTLEEVRSTLMKQKPFLEGIDFRVRDYREGFWGKGIPDAVYCDVPYDRTIAVGNRTTKFNSDEFWKWCAQMSKKSIILVSEYSCLVPGAKCLWSKTMPKSLRSKDGIDTKTEKLFCLNQEVGKKIGFGLL